MFYTIQLSIHNFHHRLSKKDFIPPKKMAQTTSTLRDHKGPKVFCDFETGENHHWEAWKVIPPKRSWGTLQICSQDTIPKCMHCRHCISPVFFEKMWRPSSIFGIHKKRWKVRTWELTKHNPPANTTRNRWRPTVHLATLRWLGLFGSVSGWACKMYSFLEKNLLQQMGLQIHGSLGAKNHQPIIGALNRP